MYFYSFFLTLPIVCVIQQNVILQKFNFKVIFEKLEYAFNCQLKTT